MFYGICAIFFVPRVISLSFGAVVVVLYLFFPLRGYFAFLTILFIDVRA